jgi:abequosyltransferase
VLANLANGPELLLVNAQVRSKDLSVPLKDRQLAVEADQDFEAGDEARLFATAASYLSFIGAVVIRRATWLARERAAYYGSLFIHVGVIFQPPAIGRTRLLARPLVHIRYGNAMWTARGFEVWMFQWPQIVWSFERFDAALREGVTPRHPACSLKVLLHYRAIGAYGPAEYARFLADGQRPHHPLARQVAGVPARWVNSGVALYCLARRHEGARMMLYDLLRSRCATGVTRWAARRLRLPDA